MARGIAAWAVQASIVRSTRNQGFPLEIHPGNRGVSSRVGAPRTRGDLARGCRIRRPHGGADLGSPGRSRRIRERGLTAIEMKLHRWTEAIRQAIAYQIAADHVWVAMPLAAASRAYRQRWTFEAEGVGLLAVDDHGHVRRPIRAAPSPRLLPFVREKVLETFRIHELPFQAAGGFLAPEEDALSPRDVGVRSAGFLTSGSGAALPSDSVLTTVSPNE